jgi:uncharacterized protein
MQTQDRPIALALHPQLSAIAQNQPHPLLFATVSGAHLYGFPSPDSDYDLRGVHVLPLSDVLGFNNGQETIELSTKIAIDQEDGLHQSLKTATFDLDLVSHDLKKFLGLLLKRNGYVLEQLYSPLIVLSTPEHDELKAIATGCITRYHSHHYLGFAKTQWRLFEKETPHRVKPLLYVYRVLLTGIHLMQTGRIEANLVTLNQAFQLPYLDDLIRQKVEGDEQAKMDEADIQFHHQAYLRLTEALEMASDRSHLQEESTVKEALQDLLVRVRLRSL